MNKNEIIKSKIDQIIGETGIEITCIKLLKSPRIGVVINQDTGEPTSFEHGSDGMEKDKIYKKITASITQVKWEYMDVEMGIIIPKGTTKISVKLNDSKYVEESDYLIVNGNKMYVFSQDKRGFGGDTYRRFVILKEGTKLKYDGN